MIYASYFACIGILYTDRFNALTDKSRTDLGQVIEEVMLLDHYNLFVYKISQPIKKRLTTPIIQFFCITLTKTSL